MDLICQHELDMHLSYHGFRHLAVIGPDTAVEFAKERIDASAKHLAQKWDSDWQDIVERMEFEHKQRAERPYHQSIYRPDGKLILPIYHISTDHIWDCHVLHDNRAVGLVQLQEYEQAWLEAQRATFGYEWIVPERWTSYRHAFEHAHETKKN